MSRRLNGGATPVPKGAAFTNPSWGPAPFFVRRSAGHLQAGATTLATGASAGFDLTAWLGLFGPAGMPKPIVAAIDAKVKSFLADPETTAKLEQLGFEVLYTSSEAFDRFVRDEYPKWMTVVKEAGLVPQ